MKILLVAATHAEVTPLAVALTLDLDKQKHRYQCTYKGHEITLLITGVGIVATAFQMGNLEAKSYDVALNVGIAGSFNRTLAIGEVLNITTDCFSELGADYGDRFIPLYSMDFAKEFDNGIINKNCEIQNTSQTTNIIITNLKQAKGITVNTINGNEERIAKVAKQFSPDVESMEGAAFLYGCMLKEIPCFQIRGISNYIEPRNLNNWNIPFAISMVNRVVVAILDSPTNYESKP